MSQNVREELLNEAYANGHDEMEGELKRLGLIEKVVPAARLNATSGVLRESDRLFNAAHSQRRGYSNP